MSISKALVSTVTKRKPLLVSALAVGVVGSFAAAPAANALTMPHSAGDLTHSIIHLGNMPQHGGMLGLNGGSGLQGSSTSVQGAGPTSTTTGNQSQGGAGASGGGTTGLTSPNSHLLQGVGLGDSSDTTAGGNASANATGQSQNVVTTNQANGTSSSSSSQSGSLGVNTGLNVGHGSTQAGSSTQTQGGGSSSVSNDLLGGDLL